MQPEGTTPDRAGHENLYPSSTTWFPLIKYVSTWFPTRVVHNVSISPSQPESSPLSIAVHPHPLSGSRFKTSSHCAIRLFSPLWLSLESLFIIFLSTCDSDSYPACSHASPGDYFKNIHLDQTELTRASEVSDRHLRFYKALQVILMYSSGWKPQVTHRWLIWLFTHNLLLLLICFMSICFANS